jgi:hypothetical protein
MHLESVQNTFGLNIYLCQQGHQLKNLNILEYYRTLWVIIR